MLTYGLLGAIAMRSASSSASSTPGAGRAVSAPSKRTPSTGSAWRRRTNHSWNSKVPLGVCSQVLRRSSVAGSRRSSRPAAAARRAVTAESGSPARSACVRARCRPRSRSPSANHASPPMLAQSVQRVPRLARAAPAALLVGESRERVEDGVEVGRNVEPGDVEVVPDVDDRGDRGGLGCLRQRAQEAGASDAAREDGDLHAVARRPSRTAAVTGPSRPSSASRSATRSTSWASAGRVVSAQGTPRPSACRRKRAALPAP